MKPVLLILAAMSVGAICALLAPSEFVLVPILVPLVLCILLAWYVAFQSKAVQLTPFRVFFWPWINTTAPLRNSRALWALYASAAFGVGGCLGLLAQVANA
jgi:hypothetical protein